GVLVGGTATIEGVLFDVLADVTMSGGIKLGGHADASQLPFEVHDPPPPAVHLPVYEAVLVARVPALTGVPELVVVDRLVTAGISYTHELNRPGQANLGLPIRSLSPAVKERLANLARFPSEVWIYRDEHLDWAGEIQTLQVQGQTLTINCTGLLGYTWRMGVTEDLVFTDEDQFTIAKALVDHWQSLEYGHYGIDTSEIGESGVTRDRIYLRDELHNIGQRLEELGAVINGFDMHVDPATRKLVLSYPKRGRDLTASVFFDERNIDSADVVLALGPDDLVTDVAATGTLQAEDGENTVTYVERGNDTLRGWYGRSWAGINLSNVSREETVTERADAHLGARDGVFFQPGVTIMPRPGADVGGFLPGDLVSYSYDAGLRLMSGTYRVAKVAVPVSEGEIGSG